MTRQTSPTGPSQAAIKRLFAHSGNCCAFPKCQTPIVLGGTIVGKICHIKAASPEGPRYDPNQTAEERHGYDNLILMCGNHHTIIDDDLESYSVERLIKMKATHEARTATLTEEAVDSGVRLFFNEAARSDNQSGGITAHTVHQTINVHAPLSEPEQGEQLRADYVRRQSDARRYLAPELNRTIERMIYIHGRANANFISASADTAIKPNDRKKDFIPHWPALYPHAPQCRDLEADDAASLIAFYDSLHSLADFVNEWYEREGQLPMNIFNMILHAAHKSLELALVCIEKFELEKLCPPPYEAWGTLSHRIDGLLKSEASARTHHMARYEAKAANKVPLSRPPRRA
jgi:hypothetical protein